MHNRPINPFILLRDGGIVVAVATIATVTRIPTATAETRHPTEIVFKNGRIIHCSETPAEIFQKIYDMRGVF